MQSTACALHCAIIGSTSVERKRIFFRRKKEKFNNIPPSPHLLPVLSMTTRLYNKYNQGGTVGRNEEKSRAQGSSIIAAYNDDDLPKELSGSDRSERDGTFCIGPLAPLPEVEDDDRRPLPDLPHSGTRASSCDSCFTRTSIAKVI